MGKANLDVMEPRRDYEECNCCRGKVFKEIAIGMNNQTMSFRLCEKHYAELLGKMILNNWHFN